MKEIQDKIKLSRQVMIIAGIFAAFTAMLLLLNFLQIKQNKPLESIALKVLVERLSTDPDNEELKQEIRNLDLLARKAYFTSQWQVRTGNYLLLFGALVFSVALWFNQKLRSKIEKPSVPSNSELTDRIMSQKWLLGAGTLLILLTLFASYLSNDYLKLYDSNKSTAEIVAGNQENIETITVSKIDSQAVNIPVSQSEDKKAADTTHLQGAIVPGNTEKRSPVSFTFESLKKQHNTFRGTFGQGISYHTNIPVDWDGAGGKNIIWKVRLEKSGFNSPVIWDDRIFIAGGDESQRMVYCLNRNTGKIIWSREVKDIPGSPASPPRVTDDTGLSAPTMAVDGTAVYAIFATGDLIAFDMEGNRLWAKNLGLPDNHYGHSSSLLVWEGKLFIQYDTNRSGRLMALDCTTGKPVWDIRKNNKISWASPVLIQKDNIYQIITTSDPFVAAYEPETGKQLWEVECMMDEVGPSVAFSNGYVFAANEYAKLVAIEVGKDNARIVWENDEFLPEAASPVASQGFLYLATSYGVVVCYDEKTGEKYWEHEAGQGFYSSPVIAEGKVYVIDMNGKMHIFKIGKEKTILGEPELGEKAFATPTFADGRIYLRGMNNLYCIGKK